MRRISTYDASSCATAKHKICHCQCRGLLHGQSHQALIQFEKDLQTKGEEITEEAINQHIMSNINNNRKKRGRPRREATQKGQR